MDQPGERLPDEPPMRGGAGESDPAPMIIELMVDPRDERIEEPAQRMPDPWAHRRGEPRLFAFLWTIYLLIAVGGSLLWLSRSTVISTSTYGPAARIMLLVVAAGATILWPMVRLSQASPRGSAVRAAMADVVVVLFPMQMILWPLVMLAQWPLGIVGALALMCTLWVLLVGGVIAIGTSGAEARTPHDRGLLARAVWMAICIAMVSAAPSLALARRAAAGPDVRIPDWVPMLSPFTAVPALTGQGFSGPQRPVSQEQWIGLASVAVPAAAAWLIAELRRRSNRSRTIGERDEQQGGLPTLSGLD